MPIERFIEQYFAARDVVNALKTEFGTDIMVDLLVKPNDSVGRLYKAGIDQIDNHVEEKYDRVGLADVLARRGGMIMSLFRFKNAPPDVSSTRFSEFIRTASSEEKKRVYSKVLKRASEQQNEILARVNRKRVAR